SVFQFLLESFHPVYFLLASSTCSNPPLCEIFVLCKRGLGALCARGPSFLNNRGAFLSLYFPLFLLYLYLIPSYFLHFLFDCDIHDINKLNYLHLMTTLYCLSMERCGALRYIL